MSHGPALAPLVSRFDIVRGVAVHSRMSASALEAGAAPIVFVHGLGVSVRYMEPTMALLAAQHAVVGPDFPGYGRSGTPPRPLRLRELAGVLAEWLDLRGIGPTVFVGNSYGCQVIAELVQQDSARATGLVLNAPTMDPAHRTVFGQVWRVFADIPREPVALAPIVLRDYLRAGVGTLLTALRDALADPIEEKLVQLRVPVLVVTGARDPVVTVRWAQEAACLVGLAVEGSPGGEAHVVAHGAHALPFDDPLTFSHLIARFVERVDTARRA